jgi:hypothetical protein
MNKELEFKNFCIAVFGNTNNIETEINSMAQDGVNIFWPDEGGLLIATFSSLAEVTHLNDFFKNNNRNFLLFEVSKEYCGYNFIDTKIMSGLFGKLKDDRSLKMKTEDFNNSIEDILESETKIIKLKEIISELTDDDIVKMTHNQKHDMIDQLIERGVEFLSDEDKKILEKLVK